MSLSILPARILAIVSGLLITAIADAAPAEFRLVGDWDLEVETMVPRPAKTTVHVQPPQIISVAAERYDRIPVFNPHAGGWVKGAQLRGVRAQETTTPGLLEGSSFVLRAAPEADAKQFERGKDYEIDLAWGTFGRTTNSEIAVDQPVFASYRHAQLRLDAVVMTRSGEVALRTGTARAAAPLLPLVAEGEQPLGNIWLPGNISKLGSDNLFPILEHEHPEGKLRDPAVAEKWLPKTMAKLKAGGHVRVLAWGDSVTDGRYVPDWQHNRWQEQFITRLRERFPKADIELVTEAWGGRNTSSYLNEPPGSIHNYREKVLAPKPDLIVSEFVNDAGLNPQQVEQRYSKLLTDFQQIGAEWIILTPHYVRTDWMGLTRERDIDNDPRPYVAGLRQFAAKHNVALADASLRYGRLWRQGIPYSTLLLNSINHPDARGMKIFADSLMALFP